MHFYSFHWEIKGHWSRVNLVKCFFPRLYKMPVSADCSISLKTEKDMLSLVWGQPPPPNVNRLFYRLLSDYYFTDISNTSFLWVLNILS